MYCGSESECWFFRTHFLTDFLTQLKIYNECSRCLNSCIMLALKDEYDMPLRIKNVHCKLWSAHQDFRKMNKICKCKAWARAVQNWFSKQNIPLQ